MSRPPLEVADLIRAAGAGFIQRSRQWIGWKHVKVLLAIARCRTAALGGLLDQCTRCGHRATISYNSCRNRHCPKSCHDLLQLLPKPALPEVSDRRSGTVDCRTSAGASPDPLRQCGLHAAC